MACGTLKASQGSDKVTSIFKSNSSNTIKSFENAAENGLVLIGTLNIRPNFKASDFFGRQRVCRLYTAGCGKTKWRSV